MSKTNNKTMNKDITVPEAADLLGVTKQYIRKLCADNRLETRKSGHFWVISKKDVERFRNQELGQYCKQSAKEG